MGTNGKQLSAAIEIIGGRFQAGLGTLLHDPQLFAYGEALRTHGEARRFFTEHAQQAGAREGPKI